MTVTPLRLAGAGIVILAALIGVSSGASDGLLFLAAVCAVALLVNAAGSRHSLVQWIYSWIHWRRPDLTWGRLNGYVIGWSLLVLAGFLLALPRIFGTHR